MPSRALLEDDLHAVAVCRADRGSTLDVIPCPVCGIERSRERLRIDAIDARVVVCQGCGLGRVHPLPDPTRVATFYPDSYYGAAERKFRFPVEWVVRRLSSRHVRFLSRGLAAGDRVLDVGCGRGVILAPLADRSLEVHGLEISEAAARGADPRARIRIAPSLAEAGYAAGSFQQVVIWHVLEHVREPRETLDEVHRILATGGRLLVAVPNFSSWQARWTGAAWFHLDPPRHLHHFPVAALRHLLAETGFEVESEHHFSLSQNPFGWIQSWMNQFPLLPRNGLYRVLHRRGSGVPPPYAASTRALLWLFSILLAPAAFALSLIAAALRRGATVHLVARRVERDQGWTKAGAPADRSCS